MNFTSSQATNQWQRPYKHSKRTNSLEERILYENRRLEAIAQAQPSSANKVKVRKRNSAVSAAEKRCLWGC